MIKPQDFGTPQQNESIQPGKLATDVDFIKTESPAVTRYRELMQKNWANQKSMSFKEFHDAKDKALREAFGYLTSKESPILTAPETTNPKTLSVEQITKAQKLNETMKQAFDAAGIRFDEKAGLEFVLGQLADHALTK
jgi:hypothetical protein